MKYFKNQNKNLLALVTAVCLCSAFTLPDSPSSNGLNITDYKNVNVPDFTPALVDFDAYEKLVAEVKAHRKQRLVTVEQFVKMSKQNKTIILDTRSDAMYAALHVKGAIHLNFSDFTQANLAGVIPSEDYTILIYCNNNFDNKLTSPINFEKYFTSKAALPPSTHGTASALRPQNTPMNVKPITLALNIPTYLNLYGYGYRNIYELSELVTTYNTPIEFEGSTVASLKTGSFNKNK